MRAGQRQVGLLVAGLHLSAVALFVLLPSLLKGRFRPGPRSELVSHVEFVELLPPAEPLPKPDEIRQAVPSLPAKPEPILRPEKKWRPTPVDQIRKGRRVEASPKPKALTEREIKTALAGVVSGRQAPPEQFKSYYASITRILYARWSPPSVSDGAVDSTVVRIFIRPDGKIVRQVRVASSGHAGYDGSAMAAVKDISMLPPPPVGYPHDYVEVVFTLEK